MKALVSAISALTLASAVAGPSVLSWDPEQNILAYHVYRKPFGSTLLRAYVGTVYAGLGDAPMFKLPRVKAGDVFVITASNGLAESDESNSVQIKP